MALVRYARVSSVGQSRDHQPEKLKGCKKNLSEKKRGTSEKRLLLEACLEYVREEDNLVVTRLDRLARSTLHLLSDCRWTQTQRRRIGSSRSKHQYGGCNRQIDGITKAKKNSVRFGAQRKLSCEQITELKKKRKTACWSKLWCMTINCQRRASTVIWKRQKRIKLKFFKIEILLHFIND